MYTIKCNYSLFTIFVICILTMPSENIAANPDWQSLFNGKDLNNWTQMGGSAHYEVVNKMIIGTTAANTPNSFLATKQHYSNFILEFEFNIDSSINSGVQFRSSNNLAYRGGRVHGYQYELDPSNRAWTAGIYDEGRRGWLYPLKLNPNAQKKLVSNRWYSARVECLNNEIKTFLNGKQMSHFIDLPSVSQSGFIALQVHSIKDKEQANKKIKWRNIRITESVDKHRLKTTKNIPVKSMLENSKSGKK